MIFCDGGIGNRINALISGLAIARHFNLAYCVYWPENNWCSASFSDIFENNFPVSKLSIKDLKHGLDDAIVLLHDDIASNSLSVEFNSAYQYASMQDFADKVLTTDKPIFFYPALMPEWIPFNLVIDELKTLVFSEYISQSVLQFIHGTLKKPFHGLHLRRTDLNVGLTDHEVIDLVSGNSDKVFFVCSDDPVAEAIASAHENVFARTKVNHVSKKNESDAWLALSADDDGRLYHGNIHRSKDAVIEGMIDLLILAHSQIVGYSGSTFQKMARLIGENFPIIKIDKPIPLNYLSPKEIERQLRYKLLTADELIVFCNKIAMQGDIREAMSILSVGCEVFEASDYAKILHTLGIFSLNQNQPKLACLFLSEAVSIENFRYSSWIHLSFAYFQLNNQREHKFALEQAKLCQPNEISIHDGEILKFMSQQTNFEIK